MKVMAASFGFAGLGFSGCRRPEQAIVPYGRQPEEVIPGVPNYYSTSLPGSSGNEPLVVESHQSRPTKIEGNPSYTPYGGGTSIYAQASVLDLYDPDRAGKSKSRVSRKNSLWQTLPKAKTNSLLQGLAKAVANASSDAKVAFLARGSSSPSRAKLVQELCSNPNIIWAEHDPVDFSGPGKALQKHFKTDSPIKILHTLSKAKRIFSLDCDFLSDEPDHQRSARDFSSGREVTSHKTATTDMNRLYSVEANLSRTGSMADHRLRLDSSQMKTFARLLASVISNDAKGFDDELKKTAKSLGIDPNWILEAAKDLVDHTGKAVVLAGSHLPAEVHVLAYAMNQALKALGNTVSYLEQETKTASTESELVDEIKKGSVKTMIFFGGNPGYDSPREWDSLLQAVPEVVRYGYSMDETSELADCHIASTHYLESWSDGFSWAQDALFPVQPLIEPLFEGISELDFLARLAGLKIDAYSLVKETFSEISGNADFNFFLREGCWKHSPKKFFAKINFDDLDFSLTDLKPSLPAVDNLDVMLVPSFHAWDGAYANNGWMQECPEPLTKLTWDNAIIISPRLAKELEKRSGVQILPKATMLNKKGVVAPDTAVLDRGKEDAPLANLKIGDSEVTGPLHVQPGLANYSLVVPLGYGRRVVGRVGEGTGFDAYPLLRNGNRILSGASLNLLESNYSICLTDDHGHSLGTIGKIVADSPEQAVSRFKEEKGEQKHKLVATKSSDKPLGRHKLANVQEHWSMEGRAIIREATAAQYKEKQDFVNHMGMESHSPPIYGKDKGMSLKDKAQTTPRGASSYEHPDHKYEHSDEFGLHQWGMAIDLNRCSGCSACVVACQSENNIPIVGKDQVLRGREMHWNRMDRYFSSEEREGAEIPEDVQVSFQGISCFHCETAPCESVCPVNATVHDEEGLNAMAYNRCVGTRYCANNCPYKVRRFNFFDWNKRADGEFYKGPLGDKNDPLPNLQKNPDVTVRMRGVMEKCTYCVQRIQEAKIRTKSEAQRKKQLATGKNGAELKMEVSELKVPDGTIKTACQQVCGSDAITFGDLSDENSAVSKMKASDRNYSVLGYLETRPRTTFLARLRNPNPSMPKKHSYKKPYSYQEYDRRAHGGDHHEGNGHKTGKTAKDHH
ncbi:MAG: hydrogenase [Opitutae bacterium]|nr:hydrogenase [Opitutae bacterium]